MVPSAIAPRAAPPPPTGGAILGVYLSNTPASTSPLHPSIPDMLTSAKPYNQLIYAGTYNGDSNCATTSTCGTPTLDLGGYGGNSGAFITDIGTWKASTDSNGTHRSILLMLNDCTNGTHASFLTSTDATNMYNGLVSMVNTYGFQGVVWDLESGDAIGDFSGNQGQCWNKTTIDSIDSQLKAHFGSSFIVAQTPRGFELHAGSNKRGWMATMDRSDIQYYFSDTQAGFIHCSGILGLEAGTDGNSQGMAQFIGGNDGGVTVVPKKLTILNWSNTDTSVCTPAQYGSAFSTLLASYPGLNAAHWTADIDYRMSWLFSSTFGPIIGLH